MCGFAIFLIIFIKCIFIFLFILFFFSVEVSYDLFLLLFLFYLYDVIMLSYVMSYYRAFADICVDSCLHYSFLFFFFVFGLYLCKYMYCMLDYMLCIYVGKCMYVCASVWM